MEQVTTKKPLVLDFDLNKSSLIEASAGTGKTFTIGYLVLRLLLGSFPDIKTEIEKTKEGQFSSALSDETLKNLTRLYVKGEKIEGLPSTVIKEISKKFVNEGRPLDIENILVVTFTNAAAADLKARILACIHETRVEFEKIHCEQDIDSIKDDVLREIAYYYLGKKNVTEDLVKVYVRLLLKAERSIDNASISTIHSFCNRALNQVFSFEAGKAFNVKLTTDISEQENMALYDVWRELFYSGSSCDNSISKNVLTVLSDDEASTLREAIDMSDPTDISKIIEKLRRVRYINKTQGYYGFCVSGISSEPTKEEKKDIDLRIKNLIGAYRIDSSKFMHQINAAIADSVTGYADISALFDEFSKDENRPLSQDGTISGPLFCTEKGPVKLFNYGRLVRDFISSYVDLDESSFDKDDFIKKLLSISGAGKKSYAQTKNGYICKDRDNLLDAVDRMVEYAYSVLQAQDKIKDELSVLVAIKVIYRIDVLCAKYNLISNDEVLRQLAVALTTKQENSDELASLLSTRYPVAMIDEFQDTDPVQYEIFSKLYLNEKAKEQKHVCYFIGDPKQSIYAFRGSDINSYNKAKQQIIDLSKDDANNKCIYSLDTNYRSTFNVIEGVNKIFEESKAIDESIDEAVNDENVLSSVSSYLAKPFDYINEGKSGIDFTPVKSPVKDPINDPKSEINPVGNVRFFFKDEDSSKNKPISNYLRCIEFDEADANSIKKETFLNGIARQVAFDVKHCLDEGLILEKGQESPCRVKQSDIAILVSSGDQNNRIQYYLNKLKIKSVYYSDRESVLLNSRKNSSGDYETEPSLEALNILFLMEAFCDYTKTSNLDRLLGSSLLKLNANKFFEFKSSSDFDNEFVILRECKSKWEQYGFSTAFSHFLNKHASLKNILTSDNGARELTNYFQISELIQSQNAKVIGPEAQLQWYRKLIINHEKSEFSEDETKKRLESELDLVKIYTVHKSKGLQYPIVFSPFLQVDIYVPSSKDIEPFYSKTVGHVVYPLVKEESASESGSMSEKILADAQEKVRLAYVALTRAQAANFIYLSNDKKQAARKYFSALKMMLCRHCTYQVKNKNKEETVISDKILCDLQSLKIAKNISGGDFSLAEDPIFKVLEDNQDNSFTKDSNPNANDFREDLLPKQYSELDKGLIDKSVTVTSYSAVTADGHNSKFGDSNEEIEENTVIENDKKENPDLINFSFPKGSHAGDFLHKLMEDYLGLESNNKDIATFVNNHLIYDYYNLLKAKNKENDSLDLTKIDNFVEWFEQILNANLAVKGKDKAHVQLADLDNMHCARELEYFIPCVDFQISSLNKICKYFYESLPEEIRPKLKSNAQFPQLQLANFKGFMKGSLDLVASFDTNEENKCFMIDYKSNYLGDRFEDYTPLAISQSIFESRYDVQILFYSLALHRYLGTVISNYNYERDFGGVMYLYLRGMKAGTDGTSTGVLYVKPKKKILDLLDKLFNGEDIPDSEFKEDNE